MKRIEAYNIADLRELARRRLPRGLFEFVDRGSEDDSAIRNNRAALERIRIRPRVLVDVSARSQKCMLFGREAAMPLVIAPTGAAGLLWHDGELAIARAAAAHGIPFTISTASLTSIERIASEVGGRLWFQLYMWPDRRMSYQLVERAGAAGCEALVVTVDTAVTPNREFNRRNGFALPFSVSRRNILDLVLHPRWLLGVMARYLATTGMPRFENFPEELQRTLTGAPAGKRTFPKNDALTWNDLRELRSRWKGPLVVKGILRADDAMLALDCGADSIIVSNHGGRIFDASISPVEALSEISDRISGRMHVMVDSSVMRGSDVVKMLALGADTVLTGRAPLWGVAAGGESGAHLAIELLRDEIDRVLGHAGIANMGGLDRELLVGWNGGNGPATCAA